MPTKKSLGALCAFAAALARDFLFLGLGCLAKRSWRTPAQPLEVKKILVFGYAAIGDLMFFLPALRALRKGYPRARLVFLADRCGGTQEVLPASNLVDDIWLYEHAELSRWSVRRRLARRVAAEGFDLLVMTPATPLRPLAQAALAVPLRVGHCRVLTARHEGWSWLRYTLWRLKRGLIIEEFERRLVLNVKVWTREETDHMVSRNLKLAEALGLAVAPKTPPALPESPAHAAFAERLLAAPGPARTVGLHLGSPKSQYQKIWRPEAWAEVAQKICAVYPCRIVLVGGADEKLPAERFLSLFRGPVIDLVGRAGLLETFAVIRRCHLFLGNDSGPVKAAMALGVPTLTVWGPTSRKDYGVFWSPEKHAEAFIEIPCAPCVRMGVWTEGSGTINFTNCGHHNCLALMTPQKVFDLLVERHDEILAGTAR